MNFQNFNWGPALFLLSYQITLLAILPFYLYFYSIHWQMVLSSIVLLYLTGLSITAGYHRFYAHRTFRTNPIIETIFLFFASMAGQGSALRWAFDHRLHHAHVDTDLDPYCIKKGFWYAHVLWIFEKPRPIDSKVVPDLMKNSLVQFQHRFSICLMLATNLLVFVALGWIFNDYIGAFVLACLLRLFFLHHFTWFINSLAHTWGDKPFCQEQTAVNNYVIALLTFGEGYHNFHHTFASDYRNGIRWYHFDPTKWLIWSLHKLDLITSLKRMDTYTIKKRLVQERKMILLDRICQLWYIKRDEFESKILELSDRIVNKIAEVHSLKETYQRIKKEGIEKAHLKEIKFQLTEMKRSIKSDWRLWVKLSRNIFKMRPLEI